MLFNVCRPNPKKVLGLVQASDGEEARVAFLASRTNTMLFFMGAASHGGFMFS